MKSEAAKIRELRDLIRHCWVHSGYRDCGCKYMTTKQRALYYSVIRRPKDLQFEDPKEQANGP